MANKLESVKCVSLYRDSMFPDFMLADFYRDGKVRVYREVKPYYHAQSRTERYKFRKADGRQADFRKFKVEQCVRRKLPLTGTVIGCRYKAQRDFLITLIECKMELKAQFGDKFDDGLADEAIHDIFNGREPNYERPKMVLLRRMYGIKQRKTRYNEL